MYDLSLRLLETFDDAGWIPGRRVEVDANVPTDHPAFEILGRYGGLHVGKTGPGEECAKSDVSFQHYPELIYDEEELGEYTALQLVTVGSAHNDHEYVLVSSDGRYFGASTVHDCLSFLGSSFSDAMEALILGRMGKPMLLPNQTSVSFFGMEIRSGDPRIYSPWTRS